MKLLVVDYAEAESMWVGETPKNIAAIFRAASEQNAVLLFDEADAIATRRSAGGTLPYDREMNLTVNVLLRELEAFNGIVIFATNLASNFDPAFERRIRTHVLFEMPGVDERARIWQLQIHPKKTPLAPDVDFRRLAERYAISGGDIKNAVIKAAAAAAAGAAAASNNEETSGTQWGWIAFGVLAAAVLVGGLVWWLRKRHSAPTDGGSAPPVGP